MKEYMLRFSRLEWAGWIPGVMDEGQESPGWHDFATTRYKAWGWLYFRFSIVSHS